MGYEGSSQPRGRGETRPEAVSMRDAVRGFLRTSGLASRMRIWPVFQAWIEAVGPELARRAKPVRFERGELVVEVNSAAHFQELASFTGEGCRARANAILGRPDIRRVVFRLER